MKYTSTAVKMTIFKRKTVIYFYSKQRFWKLVRTSSDCGYISQPAHLGNSNEQPQFNILSTQMKYMCGPINPNFTIYVKVGSSEAKYHWGISMMHKT